MKIILVLLDGLGDRSYKILNHHTPLQAAATPNLDRLAHLGSNGLFHAALPGQCLPSETAHYLLFGYDLQKFPGRGLLEAVGEGVAFEDSDVLCLAHLSGVIWKDSVPILTQGRDDIQGDEKEITELFAAITPYEAHKIRFRLEQARRNNAILILSGQASPYVSDSDPMVTGRAMAQVWPLSNNPEPEQAARTAQALNNYLTHSHKVLIKHEVNRAREDGDLPPANFLATQRCGRRIAQEPFEQRWGMAGMLVASGAMYGGLAHELGLTFVLEKEGPNPGEDLRERIRLALADTVHDFVHVHTKVPDEAAHKGDPKRKEAAIASLDRGFDELLKAVETRDDLLVVVTADHSTPSISPLIHSGEPVPVTLVGRTVRRDDVNAFDEVSAAGGCLGTLRGRELMLTILNHADRSALLGHCLGNSEKAYVAETYEPFKLTDNMTKLTR
jgi:2,3-bisphosphoglycerate-independent phosphoglycerate mutase